MPYSEEYNAEKFAALARFGAQIARVVSLTHPAICMTSEERFPFYPPPILSTFSMLSFHQIRAFACIYKAYLKMPKEINFPQTKPRYECIVLMMSTAFLLASFGARWAYRCVIFGSL